MKKKILACALSFALALSAVGCGSSKSESKSSEKTSVELLVWSPSEDQSDEYGRWLQTMCENFNKENEQWDITFKYGVASEADVDSLILQDVQASADVFMFSNDKLATLVPAGALSKLGGETLDDIKNTNSQAIIDSVSVDGSVYGVPFTTNTWFMYYDKSVFTEDDIKNLDKMIEKAKVSFPVTNAWYLASFFVANGGTLFGDGYDNEAGINFGGENGTAVTNYLLDLMSNKNFTIDADGSGIAGLRDGSVKAMFSGSWDFENVKQILGDNFGATQLPSITINGEEKQLKSFAGSKAIGVNPNTKNAQVAVALAKYLGSAEAQKAHYETRKIVPCNTELLAQEAIKTDELVVAQNATFENTSVIQPFVQGMNNYWAAAESFGKALQNGEITKANAASKTESFNTALNTDIVE